MIGGGLNIDWDGGQNLIVQAMANLDRRVRGRVAKNATAKAARYVAREAKARLTRRRTGLLHKSIGIKVKQKASGSCYARIGPRRGFAQQMVRTPKGRRLLRKKEEPIAAAVKIKTITINPVRYAHLVEKGHGGPHAARAFPFLGPALQSARMTVHEIIAGDLRKAIRDASK